MESEVNKLKLKIDLLETKVQEQDILLKNYQSSSRKARQSDNSKKGLDPKTCLEAHNADPSLQSGMYWIDPDGQGKGDNPIHVYCNMQTGKV